MSRGYPFRLHLNDYEVPVVAEDRSIVDNFQGHMLSVSLDLPKQFARAYKGAAYWIEPWDLMLLGRDIGLFCDVLMVANQSRYGKLGERASSVSWLQTPTKIPYSNLSRRRRPRSRCSSLFEMMFEASRKSGSEECWCTPRRHGTTHRV